MPVDNTRYNANRCICYKCPCYNECMAGDKENLYCASGQSNCDVEKRNCICETCPVYQEYELQRWHYCINGKDR